MNIEDMIDSQMQQQTHDIIIGEKPQRIKLTENKQEYLKQYYENNKQKFKEYNDKRKCIFQLCSSCECYVVKKHILAHQRTRKHEKNLTLKTV